MYKVLARAIIRNSEHPIFFLNFPELRKKWFDGRLISVLKKVRYALPMPYALCPMPSRTSSFWQRLYIGKMRIVHPTYRVSTFRSVYITYSAVNRYQTRSRNRPKPLSEYKSRISIMENKKLFSLIGIPQVDR
jgi:hypothetical protein